MNSELRITNYELRSNNLERDLSLSYSALFSISFLIIMLVLLFVIRDSRFAIPVFAQSPDVVAVWESDVPPESGWTVGDVIPLRLRVIAPEGFEVALPELPLSPEPWGDFEVREQAMQDPVAESGKVAHILAVKAVVWSPGKHETPALQVAYRAADGVTHELVVHPVVVEIKSVLLAVTPNAEGVIEKQDIKPQADLPRPPLWPWILAGLAVAVLLYFGGRWLWQRLPRRNKADVEEIEEFVDTRPPEVIAYEKLDYIEGLALPKQGEFKQHYSLVTECVRAYIEGRYAVQALDQTTYELMRALRPLKLKGELVALLRDLLDEADLVKFAKFAPDVQLADDALAQARHFVDITTEPESRITNYELRITDDSSVLPSSNAEEDIA